MKNKKQEWMRLGIFLLLAFAFTWIPAIILNKTVGYDTWFNGTKYGIVAQLVLFAVAAANVVTRLITKEGFGNSMLHLRLKGNVKYYLLAMLLPMVTELFAGLLVTLVYGEFDWQKITEQLSPMMMVGLFLTALGSAVPLAFVTFGEEFGWRAYMNPKMEKLMGVPATAIVGGIIWGVWHAPLTVEGHNFGKDYPGFPVVGILLMSLFCICTGCFLMWVTRKTGTVYPAAIWHAVNNFGSGIAMNLLLCGIDDFDALTSKIDFFVVAYIPTIIVGIIFFVLLVRDSHKQAADPSAKI